MVPSIFQEMCEQVHPLEESLNYGIDLFMQAKSFPKTWGENLAFAWTAYVKYALGLSDKKVSFPILKRDIYSVKLNFPQKQNTLDVT